MKLLCLWILSSAFAYTHAEIFLVERKDIATDFCVKKFNTSFLFGASTAAYQIEGGWDADKKGPNIWDTLTHEHPNLIADRSNADVGPDSYHLFEKDFEIIKELGLNVYRFSISWSRILPMGDASSLNEAGIDYYNKIIDELIQNNVEPMVTMYHYDLPEELQKFGGLANPLFIQYFRDYANIIFTHFSDRVKWWITFNEPFDYCVEGYGTGGIAPLVHAPGVGEYLCVDHTLKAHAVAYKLYHDKFFEQSRGKVGITLSTRFYFSKANDTEIVNRGMQYGLGWIAQPIYGKEGGYPQIMVDEIAKSSSEEGRTHSRLPIMSEQWKQIIKGSGDFIGINYYTSRFIETADAPTGENPSWERDSKLKFSLSPTWRRAKSSWLYSVPEGLRELLKWLKHEYDNVEIIITENGWSDDGEMRDFDRVIYMKDHMNAILQAINEDSCNVAGYVAWSLIDNFEWLKGYTEKFGLYSVNLTSPTKERSAKLSAHFYKEVIRTRSVSTSQERDLINLS